MRTRQSPRNQEILFAALFKPAAAPQVDPIASLERQLDAAPNARTRKMIEREIQQAKMRRSVNA